MGGMGGRTLAMLGLTALLVACGPGPVVRHGVLDTQVLDTIERGLVRVRGLEFTAPVPGRILDDAAVARLLDDELAEEFRPGDLERLAAVYARLGLLPAGTDLHRVFEELYADQLAALYDPRTKTLALTANGLNQRQPFALRMVSFFSGRDLLGEVLVAHELTHALQDQHFGLPTTSPPITDAQGDRIVARRALLEGDASLASVAYLRGGPLDRDTVQRFSEETASIPEELAVRHPDVPDVIRTGLAFQYHQGSVFAATAYLRGGFAAVDVAQRDPPTSTEQVLHPTKYFDVRDRPVAVTLGGTEELERRGWTRTLEDTLGELDVLVLARQTLPPDAAARIAGGWGGDRLRALARGDELAIVWLTAWDSVEDAIEFADAAPGLVAGARVERRAERVLLVVAPDADALAARVWRQSRVSAG